MLFDLTRCLVPISIRQVEPSFMQLTGNEFQGHAGGSKGLALQIKEGSLRGDVFISADPKVNALLSGPKNGDRVKWYVTFAESPLVLGISPSSRFADEAKGKPWNEVLMLPGVKIGRTDPAKDPKGTLTVELLKKADKPLVAKSVLDHSSVLPEEALVKKIQSGDLAIGFFYSVETTDAGLTAIDLPPGITPKAIYTLTIPQNAPNAAGAEQFVSFLLGSKGLALLKDHGLSLTQPQLAGTDTSVPKAIRSLLGQ
jgi:molybdate/tungstate transport system substrate-binding protein